VSRIVWTPTSERVCKAAFTQFRREINYHATEQLADYHAVHEWSIAHPEEFWPAVWRFCGLRGSRKWDRVLAGGDRMPGARWFPGVRLNFAENLLRFRDDRDALVFRGENGARRRLTFAELYAQTARLAQALREAGIGEGDRVAGFMPNLPETVVAMLAAASLGAVWSSCSPDFGVAGVLDRFGQIEPRVLFAADGYHFGGQRFDSLERLREIVAKLPGIEKVIVVPFPAGDAQAEVPTGVPAGDPTGRPHDAPAPDLSGLPSAITYADFLAPATVDRIEFAQLPFDHPLYIMYSSGTTGLPKCMVHSAGGTLIQHAKEHVLHCDIGREDRVFYYTTCGWMMWNWLVSALTTGATVMLYDGSPMHPDHVLWDYAAQEQITIFGTSAKYLAACQKHGLHPGRSHDLSALRTILSTGSVLAPESFDYVYQEIKEDVQLSSITGGTDLLSCFALGSPVLPVRRGELQCRGLGMAVAVFDDAGQPVVGHKGELVCTTPFPSMPVGFWNDPDGEKYRAAYFAPYPGVWAHGDFAELRPEGGMVIHGRSDAVLNPGGVRIGTAEIYRVVVEFDEVLESVVVGQEWQNDVRGILFVRLREDQALDDDLAERIRARIRAEESPRHVPTLIIQVAAIPHTISGKIVELAVREVIHGRPVKNADALANPEALELFRDLPELR